MPLHRRISISAICGRVIPQNVVDESLAGALVAEPGGIFSAGLLGEFEGGSGGRFRLSGLGGWLCGLWGLGF